MRLKLEADAPDEHQVWYKADDIYKAIESMKATEASTEEEDE